MKKYRRNFRKVREQKGSTIQQIADGILSISFLSKFERGESDISISYFFQILERLSLSYEEFLYVHIMTMN